ncbi:MAG: DUF3109 family protein [Ignavibacteriales bacterium]|nr:DUF3109 family protein [Ignavibacteriales bacterium]
MSRINFVENELTIDPFLFSHGYKNGDSPLQCDGKCCSYGVYVDVEEHKKILANTDSIKKYFDETQTTDVSKWFEQEFIEDKDFPSGKCIGTEVFNDKCVFLNKSGKCTLQQMSIAEGKHPWDLKPYYCITYPLAVIDKKIEWDDMLDGERPCCTARENFNTSCAQACGLEMNFILGKNHENVLTTKHNEL